MASAIIGALRVTLGMDTAEFEKGAAKAGKSMNDLTGLIKTAGGVLAGAFTLNAIKNALEYAGSLGEISQQLGVTVEQLQIYRFAATQVNITQEEMEKGLGKLSKSIGEASLGALAQQRAFAALGINLKDARGHVKATGDVMLELADSFKKIDSPAQQAAVATQFFGKAGQKMIPLLIQGSEGIKKYAEEAAKLGIIITSEMSDKADKASDRLALLNKQLSVQFSSIVAQNADSIYSMANALGQLVTAISKFWDQHPKEMMAVLGGLAGLSVGKVFGPQGAIVGGALGVIGGYLLGPDPRRTSEVIKKEIADIQQTISEGKETIAKNSSLGISLYRTDKSGDSNKDIKRLKDLQAELAATTAQEKLMADAAKGLGKPLDQFLAPDKLTAGLEQFKKGLVQVNEAINKGFDAAALPVASQKAEELRRKIIILTDAAKEAGVGVGAFSGQIAVLKARISELETVGLEKESKAFTIAVEKEALAVGAYAHGDLPDLQAKLLAVDDQYNSLRDQILKEIEDNTKLAESNKNAAAAMATLKDQLITLEKAHKQATAAALAQHDAENLIANLQAQAQGRDIAQSTLQLKQQRGDFGAIPQQILLLQQTEADLNKTRIDAAIRLTQMEAEKAVAEQKGDTEQVTRLNGLISLQQTYYDTVANTTAAQIIAAERAKAAWDDFTNNLSSALTDMVVNFNFSLNSLKSVFQSLITSLFVRPAMNNASDAIGGFLKSALGGLAGGIGGSSDPGVFGDNALLFSGAFATGGVIPAGHWGIAGEQGPEPIFAGDKSLTVFPNSTMGGSTTQIFNIQTPDANSFRLSQRQISRQARLAMS